MGGMLQMFVSSGFGSRVLSSYVRNNNLCKSISTSANSLLFGISGTPLPPGMELWANGYVTTFPTLEFGQTGNGITLLKSMAGFGIEVLTKLEHRMVPFANFDSSAVIQSTIETSEDHIGLRLTNYGGSGHNSVNVRVAEQQRTSTGENNLDLGIVNRMLNENLIPSALDQFHKIVPRRYRFEQLEVSIDEVMAHDGFLVLDVSANGLQETHHRISRKQPSSTGRTRVMKRLSNFQGTCVFSFACAMTMALSLTACTREAKTQQYGSQS